MAGVCGGERLQEWLQVQRRAPVRRQRAHEPTRQSARNQSKPAPRYCDKMPLERSVATGARREAPCSRATAARAPAWRWVCTGGHGGRTGSKVLYQSDPDTSASARHAAETVAEERVYELHEAGSTTVAAVVRRPLSPPLLCCVTVIQVTSAPHGCAYL